MLDEKTKESFARVASTGYVIMTSKVPILFKDTNERISYFSGEIWNNQCDRAPIEHIHYGNCEAVIKSHGGKHKFSVIGDDVDKINYLIHFCQHILGAKDIPVPIVRRLPQLKSFWERIKFLTNWLLHGEEKSSEKMASEAEKADDIFDKAGVPNELHNENIEVLEEIHFNNMKNKN